MHPKKNLVDVVSDFRRMNPSLRLLAKPVSLKGRIEIKCMQCKTVFTKGFQYAASRTIKCIECSPGRGVGISHKKFCLVVSEKGPGYTVLSTFTNMTTKVRVKCKQCNHVRKVGPQSIYYKDMPECPACRIPPNTKGTHADFVQDLATVKPHIKVLGVFEGLSKPVRVVCVDCDYKFTSQPNVLLHAKYACLQCARLSTGYARKKIKLKGRLFTVQGYEDLFLKKIAKAHPTLINEIETGRNVPFFNYVGKGPNNRVITERCYRPDFFIPSRNQIVEIKSDYTAFGNKAWFRNLVQKRAAVINKGYKFALVVFNKKQERVCIPADWFTRSYSGLLEALALA